MPSSQNSSPGDCDSDKKMHHSDSGVFETYVDTGVANFESNNEDSTIAFIMSILDADGLK